MGHEAAVRAISVYLPEGILDNAELVCQFETWTWTENKIYGKTGVLERRVVGDEKVLDLAAAAGERLFEEHGIDRSSIDYSDRKSVV